MLSDSFQARLATANAVRAQLDGALARTGYLRFVCFLVGMGAVWLGFSIARLLLL